MPVDSLLLIIDGKKILCPVFRSLSIETQTAAYCSQLNFSWNWCIQLFQRISVSLELDIDTRLQEFKYVGGLNIAEMTMQFTYAHDNGSFLFHVLAFCLRTLPSIHIGDIEFEMLYKSIFDRYQPDVAYFPRNRLERMDLDVSKYYSSINYHEGDEAFFIKNIPFLSHFFDEQFHRALYFPLRVLEIGARRTISTDWLVEKLCGNDLNKLTIVNTAKSLEADIASLVASDTKLFDVIHVNLANDGNSPMPVSFLIINCVQLLPPNGVLLLSHVGEYSSRIFNLFRNDSSVAVHELGSYQIALRVITETNGTM